MVCLSRRQPATLVKVTLLHGRFSRFLNCTNGTKSRKTFIFDLCRQSYGFDHLAWSEINWISIDTDQPVYTSIRLRANTKSSALCHNFVISEKWLSHAELSHTVIQIEIPKIKDRVMAILISFSGNRYLSKFALLTSKGMVVLKLGALEDFMKLFHSLTLTMWVVM